jgi:peptidoglycan/xylan/chitin deacetylase (PgdA/CDA1 family)
MFFKKSILLSFLISLLIAPGFGQVPGKICNWDNDKKAAVVLTFDDWSSAHYHLVTPELKSRNINATFFIPTNAVSDWSQLQTEVSDGNEIANHSKSHPDLTKVTAAEKMDEIRGAKTLIDQNVTGRTTTTYAYPYGNFNSEIIDSLINSGHIASRGVWPSSMNYTYDFATKNADYYNILTYGMNENATIDDFYTQIKNVMNGGGLLTYLFHCIVNTTYPASSCGTAAIELEVFKKHIDTLVFEKNNVWITTFEKAIKYHREKKSASLSEIQAPNGVQWVLNLTDTLNNNIFNLPLTIKLKMNGVDYNQVLQNGNPVTIDNIKNDTITFHAVPDGGQIILKASTGTYLNIYTDNNSMICTGCTWSSGTLTEESNAGAVEGVKDYLFSYTIQNGWAGLGLNISNWSSNQAKDFSGYDNLQLSYLGPVDSGNAFISLSDTSGISVSVNLQTVSSYTTLSIPMSSFTGIDLSQITSLNISLGGASGSGTLRIDNIKVTTNSSGATGTILREYWTGISGTAISDLTSNTNYPNSPSGSEQLTSLEGTTNWADNYGTRIRGYIHPTSTGDYTFWVAGDDNTELYLSTDENSSNMTRIAYVNGWTNSREWDKYSTQQSASMSLTAGQKYYIEVLHKEGIGGDNMAVAWQGPNITQQVIGGSYLSSYALLKSTVVENAISSEAERILNNSVIYPNPTSDGKFTITLPEITENVTISLSNVQGKLLYQKDTEGLKQIEFNQQLNAGIYLLRVSTNKFFVTKKLVVN